MWVEENNGRRQQQSNARPPRRPCPNLWNLTWQRGIQTTGGMKVVNHLTLDKDTILGYPGAPTGITRVPATEEGGRGEPDKETGRRCAAGFEDGARGQEPRKAHGLQRQEKPKKWFSPRASRKNTNLPSPWLQLSESCVGILYRLWDNKCVFL